MWQASRTPMVWGGVAGAPAPALAGEGLVKVQARQQQRAVLASGLRTPQLLYQVLACLPNMEWRYVIGPPIPEVASPWRSLAACCCSSWRNVHTHWLRSTAAPYLPQAYKDLLYLLCETLQPACCGLLWGKATALPLLARPASNGPIVDLRPGDNQPFRPGVTVAVMQSHKTNQCLQPALWGGRGL